ncbi:MAG: glycine cleavage system protein GcvH [Candidatus Izemoplasmatales bacterium]|jgi:glycine cleavage system H protein|nr:glycine cleavage system protein GcvH [Candidatus Izemoplasmatales bacterium]MDD3865411.1 glycine cleavage system protein GcvH [Candidatus Izemoplasmatales bacterium]
MSKVVEGLYYAQSHEWLKVEGNIGIIGVSDFAQAQLGSIVFVDLPEVGIQVTKEVEFGAVESVKAASDLLSPISGVVIENNQAVIDDPELINKDAFANWLIKVEIANPSEIDQLLSAADYRSISK